jgi:hypothetical protein
MTDLDPAAIHSRSIAMVRHVARHDYAAAQALLPPLDGGEAGAQLGSLVQLGALLMAQVPDGDAVLERWVLALAQGDAGPGGVA